MSKPEDMKRPSLSIDIATSGETKTIYMSYGLLIDLQKIVPNAADVLEVLTSDPISRDFLVRRCFTDSKKAIDKIDEFVDEIPVDDPDEIQKLLDWVADHLFYFFTKSARSMAEMGNRYKDALPTEKKAPSPPSTDGSKDSTSSQPTAGPSTAVSET